MNDADKERRIIREVIDDFLKKLGLSARYTVRFTKYESWRIRLQGFSGSFEQRFMLETHLAVELSKKRIHNAVVYWM